MEALRWMRHQRMIGSWPLMYFKLLFLYGSLLVSNPFVGNVILKTRRSHIVSLFPHGRKFY